MTKEQKLVCDFLSEFDITDINVSSIKGALKAQGFTVVEYSHVSNDDNTEALLVSLGLKYYSMSVDAFTYIDKNMRLVFILENLSESEQLILLAHEQGHISCQNILPSTISGQNILHENQANEFAHYLLKISRHKGIIGSFLRNPSISTIIMCLVAILVLVVTASVSIYFAASSEKQNWQQKYEVIDVLNQTQPTDDNQIPPHMLESTTDNSSIFSDQNTSNLSDNYVNADNTTLQSTEASDLQTDFYYVTKSGTKYHVSTCGYIQGKDNLTKISTDTVNSYDYLPCSKCIE